MEADQLIQIAGATLVVAAYIGSQLDRLDPHSRAYLALNLVGAGVLTVLAAAGADWGFLLLEGVWFVVSAWGLGRSFFMGRRETAAAR